MTAIAASDRPVVRSAPSPPSDTGPTETPRAVTVTGHARPVTLAEVARPVRVTGRQREAVLTELARPITLWEVP